MNSESKQNTPKQAMEVKEFEQQAYSLFSTVQLQHEAQQQSALQK